MGLPFLFADLSFVNRLIQMLDCLDPMAVEIVGRGFEMMLGIPHRFECFGDVGMRLRRGGCRRCGGNRSHCWNRRPRGFWSGCRRREGQRKEKCCHDEQSQQPDLFQMFLLVRISGSDATGVISTATDIARTTAKGPRHPHSIDAPARADLCKRLLPRCSS